MGTVMRWAFAGALCALITSIISTQNIFKEVAKLLITENKHILVVTFLYLLRKW